ncbi:MAG: hypothetical protein EXR79_01435 [Myxococcales bacterium]|nr:hypothetical protein [Myxococcales bacterium]
MPDAPSPSSAEAAAVGSLVAALRSLEARVAALEAAAGVARASAAVAAPVPTAAAEPLTVAAAGEAPTQAAGPYAPPGRSADPMADVRAVLRAMFDLALHTTITDSANLEQSFEQFKELVHSERKGSPLLNQELLRYKFFPLCERARSYLARADDPASFEIDKTTPDRVDGNTFAVRVFLKADRRMPPPIALKRDERVGGAFRIENSSL